MRSNRFADRKIVCYDRARRREVIAYGDLLLPFGEGVQLSLADYLVLEEQKISELRENARETGVFIDELNAIYASRWVPGDEMMRRWVDATADLAQLPTSERIDRLNSYYLIPGTRHGELLDRVMAYMMCGSEGDHSPHEISLIRFALDLVLWSMRHARRKNGVPGAYHAVESARSVAKNGQPCITIMGALCHDVLEETLDLYTDRLVARVIASGEPLENPPRKGGKPTEATRLEIIRRHLDAYNTRASGIYYALGLFLFYHVRLLPFPERHCEMLRSLMCMLENLSRTRDMSYFSYVDKFMYPKGLETPDPIARQDLLAAIGRYFPSPERHLDDYFDKIEGYGQGGQPTEIGPEEMQRNAFREILCKIVDRLHNTRDLDRPQFSVSRRLYGAGFKNLYVVQAIEKKMAQSRVLRSDEQRIIERKFLHKPKVAALYQMIDETEYIGRKLGPNRMGQIAAYMDYVYKRTRAFREVRFCRPDPEANPAGQSAGYDGMVAYFTRVLLGSRVDLEALDKDLDWAAAVSTAFCSLFEAFIAHAALVDRERSELGATAGDRRRIRTRFEPFRIRGLNASLERRLEVDSARVARDLPLTTFRRRVF
jgi:hypothetical protein